MKILLHTCCAPCLLYPVSILKKQGFEITSYFFNPNIHPFKEYAKRRNTLVEYSNQTGLDLFLEDTYGLVDFNRKVAFHEENRCSICYDIRLEKLVFLAKEKGFEAFSTTLLYSKYQKHDLIKEKCKKLSQAYEINFFYLDFRDGWQEGIDQSISLDLYRQPYCGCMYSEWERYDNKIKKKFKNLNTINKQV